MLIRIDTHANTGQVAGQAPVRFSRRWEATVLALMVRAGQTGLSEAALQRVLHARGQATPLNRTQVKRLFDNIAQFAGLHADGSFAIVTAPRKATVGPWRIEQTAELTWLLDGEVSRSVAAGDDGWPYPGITCDPDETMLCQFLHELLLSDGFAAIGEWDAARDALPRLEGRALREEARALVRLRQVTCLRRTGRYAEALVILGQLRAAALSADPALAAYIDFLFLRTQYDQAPGSSHESLLRTTRNPPAAACDTRTQPEWHNLRGLLLRRSLLTLALDRADVSCLQATHREILRHFEAAIYYALWHADWTRLQAYVTNVGFYLQTWGDLTQWQQGVTLLVVLRWQGLGLAYADKFDAGRESAWECIFFAEFWLDHPIDLKSLSQRDRNAQEVSGLLPDQEAFYQHAVHRLRKVADPRQLGIMLTLYLRFARHHLPHVQGRMAVEEISAQLQHLFTGEKGARLRETLAEEGYARWWPADWPRTLGR